LNANYLIN